MLEGWKANTPRALKPGYPGHGELLKQYCVERSFGNTWCRGVVEDTFVAVLYPRARPLAQWDCVSLAPNDLYRRCQCRQRCSPWHRSVALSLYRESGLGSGPSWR